MTSRTRSCGTCFARSCFACAALKTQTAACPSARIKRATVRQVRESSSMTSTCANGVNSLMIANSLYGRRTLYEQQPVGGNPQNFEELSVYLNPHVPSAKLFPNPEENS